MRSYGGKTKRIMGDVQLARRSIDQSINRSICIDAGLVSENALYQQPFSPS